MLARLVRACSFVIVNVERILAFSDNSVSQCSGLGIDYNADRNWVGNHARWAGIIRYLCISGLHCLTEPGVELHRSFDTLAFDKLQMHRTMRTAQPDPQNRDD